MIVTCREVLAVLLNITDYPRSVMSVFFFQAEDGIRDAQESRGLGDVYKRQNTPCSLRRQTQQRLDGGGGLRTGLELQHLAQQGLSLIHI